MEKKPKPPTINEVAALAEVGVGTVSRYLKNHSAVKPKTRAFIERAIQELAFVPNEMARRLAQGKSNNILLMMLSENPIFTSTWLYERSIIQGIYDALEPTSYTMQLIMGFVDKPNDIFETIRSNIYTRSADGVILLSTWHVEERAIGLLEQSKTPYVLLGNSSEVRKANEVLLDNYGATRMLLHHLMELGHTRIGLITGNQEQQHMHERIGAFFSIMQENGLDAGEECIAYGDYSVESGYHCARRLLTGGKCTPTALICGNDFIAAGAMKAADDLHREVPASLSVAGYDNLPLTELMRPALTTVQFPGYEMGLLSVQKIFAEMQNPGKGVSSEILSSKLIIRASTAPLNESCAKDCVNDQEG